MTSKIEVCKKFDVDACNKVRHTPMPRYGYIIKDHDFENKFLNKDDSIFLDNKEIKKYLGIVESLA